MLRDWQTPFAVILLFLVLIIPLRLLADKVAELQKHREEWFKTTSQARLHEELDQFKNDLTAEAWVKNFVDSRLEKLDLESVFLDLSTEQSDYLRRQKLDEIYLSVKKALQVGGRVPQPFFMVVTDNLVQDFRYDFAVELRQNGDDDKDTALFLSNLALRSLFYRLASGVQVHLEKGGRDWDNGSSTRKGISRHFRKLLSNYKGREPENRKVRSYLSDLYGFSELHYYSYVLEHRKEVTGLVVIGYLAPHIGRNDIIRSALARSAGRPVRRLISKNRPVSAPAVQNLLFEALPEAALQEKNLFVGVELLESAVRPYAATLNGLNILAGFIVLASYAMFLHSLFFGLSVQTSLRKKLMIILAPALFLPAVLVAITARGISDDYLSSRADMAQNYLASALDELELTYQEGASRLTLNHMRLKLGLNQYWKNALGSVPEEQVMKRFMSFDMGRSYLYDRAGRSIHLRGTSVAGSPDRIMANNAVRLLNNLSGLEANQRTRRQLENLEFTDGLVEEISDNLVLLETSACEGEVAANPSTANVLSREIYHLYADWDEKPVRPRTVGFFGIQQDKVFKSQITSNPVYPHGFFERQHDEYRVAIGMASRDNEYMGQEFWLDFSQRRPVALKRLFDKAMDLRFSGDSLSEDAPDSVSSWRFFIDRPLIFAGTATFSADSMLALYLDIVPFALFAYSILILLVISEVLSRLFVSPLDVVSQGVKSVAAGEDLALRLQIASNDEFDLMGHAFNGMTAGLLQKHHISRFVSDRLLLQLAQTGPAGDTTEYEVTVLASDLRNFTGISESYPPEVVVEVLNDYFTAMEEAIKAAGGSIDKFIGDAIIAVFYEQEGLLPAVRACRAASDMRKRLAAFNQSQQLAGKLTIENGIGLATGMVISASLGEESGRREFIVTGAAVARAEELEALSKLGRHSKIIVDAATYGNAEECCTVAPLEGFDKVFELTGFRPCE